MANNMDQNISRDTNLLSPDDHDTLFSPLRLVVTLVICIFAAEFLVMVALHNMPRLSPVYEFLLDALLLSLALCPILAFKLLRPLRHLVDQYQINEKQLRDHKEHLEQEVQARTAALQINKDFLEAIIESIASPLFYKDSQGFYLGCNTQFSTYLGFTKEQIIGRSVFDIAPPELAAVYHRADMELMEQRGTQTYEAQVRYADGTLHDIVFNKSVIIHRDGQIGGLVGVMLDMTQLKQAEEEKEKLTQNLIHSQKIESIGRLAAGVAHDFNNLLTPILGYSEMLRKSIGDNERANIRLNGIIDSATRARDLTRQLLAFGRKQLLEMKPLDLNQVIESFYSILSRTIRGDISMTLKLTSEPWHIMADRGQLEQIIMNLAINAQDAIADNGTLIIETDNVSLLQTPIGNNNLQPGDYAMLMVSDNGKGMDAETISHIFEPFYTTKEAGHGTGLGLATVYGIVSQHGGSVNVYSEPGYGTTFKLYFPRVDAVPREVPPVESAGEWRAQHGKTVLLVEDNPSVREVAREVLDEAGYWVLEADGAEQALMQLNQYGKPVDLLLSDVIMPGMNGPELYEELKKIQPELKVLYMSGYSENIITFKGVEEENPHYIRKPFAPQALLKKMAQLITP